jgi:hypothetical protein
MTKISFLTIISIVLLQFSLSAQDTANKSLFKLNDSTTLKLPDVFVKAQRPILKVVGGKLQYNIPNLIKYKPVDNAFDVLKELPGISMTGDQVAIIGTTKTNILINNRLSSMTLDQVISMLKSTSAGKVKKIEVMYSTPPQYGVRGAAINIIMEDDKTLKDVLKGEVALTGKQAYYFSPSGRVNLSYTSGRFSTDFSYSLEHDNSRRKEYMQAFPTFENQPYTVDQANKGKTVINTHNVRGVLEYETAAKSHLTFTYTGSFDQVNSNRTSLTSFVNVDTVSTNNHITGPTSLHSFRLDYITAKGLSFGGDYVLYNDRTNQEFLNSSTLQTQQAINSNSSQHVQRGNVYVNMTSHLAHEWELNYGITGSVSKTDNKSFTNIDNLLDNTATFDQTQKEQSTGTFMGFTKQLSEKLSLQASLSLQYYKATVDSLQHHRTLWSRLDLFPNMTLSYNRNENNTFQLSFSSDKVYPTYWQTSPSHDYINAYSYAQGNPNLLPERTYSTNLNYIVHKKYVLSAFFNHESGNIEQMPYQNKTSLSMIYTTINMDYRNMPGLSADIPFKVSNLLESKLTTTGILFHDKGTLFDIQFNRKKLFGYAALDNTIFLTKKKDWFLSIDGYYQTAAIQGIYSTDPTANLNTALIWKFAGDKARLTLKAEDMLNSRAQKTHIHIGEQQNNMTLFYDSRLISLTFKYSFSGYKKKEVEGVDTSRFGNKL